MSELTKEKIYKKELEKVGGEGNNNLERIRSLAGSGAFENIVDKNGNLRFVEGEISTGTFSGVTFTYAKWSLSGTHLMLVISFDITSSPSISTNDVLAYVDDLPDYIYNKIYGTVLDWKNSNVFNESVMVNNLQVYLKKQNNRLEFVAGGNYPGGGSGTDRVQFDLLIDSE